jgi:hypothetical protein
MYREKKPGSVEECVWILNGNDMNQSTNLIPTPTPVVYGRHN